VLSDGSTDETNALVRGYSGKLRVRLFELSGGGKSAALNRGLAEVKTELVVLTDVRQEFDRAALAHLVSCFADPGVGVVTGELVIRDGVTAEEINTGLYWKYEKWIRRNLNRIDAMLGATGAIYAIRRELTSPIPPETLLDDVYLPLAAALKGYRVYFECDAKAYDFPTNLRSEFRRKVRTQAGVYQILGQLPRLLWPGNRRFIHFLSHKVGRLVLPFAMLAVVISSFFLPAPWRALALTGQGLFYAAAAIDPYVPEGLALKRISGVSRTFVVLVAAALCAVSIFFVPAQWLWKDARASVPPRGSMVAPNGTTGSRPG
jgi:cellulose synthase/poly-beta-1,6-N-acetylglucosamine synthase-like glycosyltransferase